MMLPREADELEFIFNSNTIRRNQSNENNEIKIYK